MPKLFIKGMVGVLLLGILGVFIFRIYQQREALKEFYPWLISGKYFSQGVNVEQMHQYLMIKELNDSIPPLVKIYNASNVSGAAGLEKSDIDDCRKYYHKVLEYMPQMQEAHVFLGLCEDKAGNMPEAFDEFKQGLDSDAGVFWASYDLGVLALMSGNNDAAEVLFINAVKLPPQEVLKSILASKLFQQYMQVNNITSQKIWDGLNEARSDAIQDLKSIEQSRTPNPAVPAIHEVHLRIF